MVNLITIAKAEQITKRKFKCFVQRSTGPLCAVERKHIRHYHAFCSGAVGEESETCRKDVVEAPFAGVPEAPSSRFCKQNAFSDGDGVRSGVCPCGKAREGTSNTPGITQSHSGAAGRGVLTCPPGCTYAVHHCPCTLPSKG